MYAIIKNNINHVGASKALLRRFQPRFQGASKSRFQGPGSALPARFQPASGMHGSPLLTRFQPAGSVKHTLAARWKPQNSASMALLRRFYS